MSRPPLPPIFLVCTQEETPQAEVLAQALRAHGLVVSLDGAAAESAACLLLLWSAAARGPEGERMRAWSAWGQARNLMVRATLDGTTPTLTGHERPPVDLSGWDGRTQAPAFQSLLGELAAQLRTELTLVAPYPDRSVALVPSGLPAHPPAMPAHGQPSRSTEAPSSHPSGSLSAPHGWRLTLIGLGTLVLAVVALLVADLFGVQRTLCELPWNQPELSDTCGAWGLGRQPTRAERLAWAERPKGNCDAVRDHVQRFPNGAYRSLASEILATAKAEATGNFYQAPSQKNGFVPYPDSGAADEASARREVLARAQVDAVTLLCGFTEEEERLLGVRVEPNTFDCRKLADGKQGCSLDYIAHCNVEQPKRQDRCN